MIVNKVNIVHYSEIDIELIIRKLQRIQFNTYLKFKDNQRWVMPAYLLLGIVCEKMLPGTFTPPNLLDPSIQDFPALDRLMEWYKKQIIRCLQQQITGFLDFDKVTIEEKIKPF